MRSPALKNGRGQVSRVGKVSLRRLRFLGATVVALIAFAAVVTVWEISGLIRAYMGALSRVYDHDEDRPWWIRFPISIALAAL